MLHICFYDYIIHLSRNFTYYFVFNSAHAHATCTRPFAFPPPREKSGPGYEANPTIAEPCWSILILCSNEPKGGKCILMVTNTIYLLAGLADKESKLHLPYYYILSIIVSLTNCTAMCRTLVQSGLLRLHIRHLTKLRSSPLTKVSQCFSLLWMSRTRNSKCDTM